jgi:hypothetical protein
MVKVMNERLVLNDAYNKNDGAAADQVASKALINDMLSGMYI